jgi:hypothetical protein
VANEHWMVWRGHTKMTRFRGGRGCISVADLTEPTLQGSELLLENYVKYSFRNIIINSSFLSVYCVLFITHNE